MPSSRLWSRPRLILAMHAAVGMLWVAAFVGEPVPRYTPAVGLAGYIALGFALTRRANALAEEAQRDPLTHVLTRGAFDAAFAERFVRLGRRQRPLALLLIDLDGLKVINDSLGHRAGDAALRRVGECLLRTVRASDLVARYGGDEFIVAAEDTGSRDALRLAERLRASLCSLGPEDPFDAAPTVSIGVSVTPNWGVASVSQRSLFEAADHALYRSKNSGGDCANLGQVGWLMPRGVA